MDLKIKNEKEDKVFDRLEIDFVIEDARTTPSRKELKQRISALKNSKEELVSIDFVKQSFGEHIAKGKAFIYSNKERLKRIEPEFLAKREKEAKKAKTSEKPAATALVKGKAEEKSAEEKAEEKPAEEKKEESENKE